MKTVKTEVMTVVKRALATMRVLASDFLEDEDDEEESDEDLEEDLLSESEPLVDLLDLDRELFLGAEQLAL